MNTVKVYFTINNVIHTDVNLNTVSAETNKPIYKIRVHSGSGPYYLEEAKKNKNE